MRYILTLLLFIVSTSLQAEDWPPALAQSMFDNCIQMGGTGQCQCVVVRLQQKFTFEDIRLSTSNRLAKESLRQMTRAFNVKCLGKEYKEKTLRLKNFYVPRKADENRFR